MLFHFPPPRSNVSEASWGWVELTAVSSRRLHSFPASLTHKWMALIHYNCLLSLSSSSLIQLWSSLPPPFSHFFRVSVCLGRLVESLVVSWKRDGRHLHSGSRLVIPAPSSSDAGLYVCEASLSNSTGRPAEAMAQLTVIGKEETHTHTHRLPALLL